MYNNYIKESFPTSLPEGKTTPTVKPVIQFPEDILTQGIDPEEFQYPAHDLIPPDENTPAGGD